MPGGVVCGRIINNVESKTVSGGRDFKTVQELAEFLKQEPEIARQAGYILKKAT